MPKAKAKKHKKKKDNKKTTLGPSNGIVKLRNTRIEQYGNKGKKTERQT